MLKNKSTFHPLVSIIIPIFNGANYMREAIDSAINQTYKNIEVIVVNDGSTDNTEEIAVSYGDKIKYFYKENSGVATALNLAIEKSTGEYISWLSHDDMYYLDKIESQINLLVKNEEKRVIVFGDVSRISAKGDKISDQRISERCKKSLKCLLAIDLENTLNGCTFLIPKNVFGEFGFFDIDKKYTQDYFMWFNLVKNNVPFLYIDKLLVFSRQHERQGGKIDPIGATEESDQLHSDLISEISNNEIDKYCDNSVDFLMKIYKKYLISGYYKTSFRLLKHITRIAFTQKKEEMLFGILNEAIFSFSDDSKTKSTLEDQIKKYFVGEKTKKRILIYSNVWTKGGVERVISVISNYLVKYYDIVLVSGDKEFKKSFILNPEVVHVKISEDNEEKVANRLAALSVLLDVDLFIGNPNIIYHFLDVYKLFSELNIKTIAFNHGSYFLPFMISWLYPIIKKRLIAYKYINAVTWATNFSTNAYKQLNSNSACMPNPNTFKVIPEILIKKEKVVLCVGRFYDSIKRLDRVLRVFKKVLEKHPDSKLILVGDYDPNIKIPSDSNINIGDLLKKLNIPKNNISFEGEQDDVEKYYKKASVLVLTSDSEGFGMVLVEAGFFGIPCVINEIPGLDDIIVDKKNGFIVAQDDIQGMAERIDDLLFDSNLCYEMGKNAQELAKKFDQDIICERWNKLINLVLASDNQKYLNDKLLINFTNPIDNFFEFTSRLFCEYKKNINLPLANKLNEDDSTRRFSDIFFKSDILQIGDNDLIGNKFNGHDLHLYLNKKGIITNHLVWNKESSDTDTFEIARGNFSRNEIYRNANLIQKQYSINGILNPLWYDVLYDPFFLNSELIHFHLIHNGLVDLQLLPLMSRLKPIVWTLHDPWAFSGKYIEDIEDSALSFEIKKNAIQNSNIEVIVASKFMFDQVQKSIAFKDKNIHLIPFGINQDIFKKLDKKSIRKKFKIPSDSLVISFRSDNRSRKGVDYVEYIIQNLKTEKNVYFISFGGGDFYKNKKFKYIEFGWIKDDLLMADIYNASDLFLMPSTLEAFGMMAIEAMSCGVVPFVLDGTALPEIVSAPECGVSIKRDKLEFLNNIQYFINNEETQEKRADKCLKFAKDYYNKEVYIEKLIDVYNETKAKFKITNEDKQLIEQLKAHPILEFSNNTQKIVRNDEFLSKKKILIKNYLRPLITKHKKYIPLQLRAPLKKMLGYLFDILPF